VVNSAGALAIELQQNNKESDEPGSLEIELINSDGVTEGTRSFSCVPAPVPEEIECDDGSIVISPGVCPVVPSA
jgi:hypothetical protein